MTLRRSILIVLSVLGTLLVAILLYLAFGDLSRYKGHIESLVSGAIGRPFAIDGAFQLEVLPSILVHAEGIHLGNAPGGSTPRMVEIGRFSTQIGLWSLISGPVDIRSFELSDVAVILEKDANGKGNWVFGDEAGADADSHGVEATGIPAVILHASLDNVRVTYRESGKPERVALIETFTIEPAAGGLFAIAGKGGFSDYPVDLKGEIGPLGALLSGRDIRMAIQAAMGNLRFDLEGVLGQPDPLDNTDLSVKIEHPELEAMLEDFHLPVFATGAMSIESRLSDAGDITRVDVDAKFGDLSAKVEGSLRSLGLPGAELSFEVSMADAARVAAAFDVAGLPAGAAMARGRVEPSRTEIKLEGIRVQYAGVNATADGTISTNGDQGAAIRFSLAAENLATLREGLPAIPMSMSGNYAGSSARIEVKDLTARVGEIEFSATASMTRTGQRHIEADITLPVLDLTPFLATDTNTTVNTTTDSPPKTAATKFIFNEEPVSLGKLKGLDAWLHLAVGELKFAAGALKDVDGTVKIGDGHMAFEGRARGGVEGGLSGSFTLAQDADGIADLDLKITASDLRAGFGAGGGIGPGETPSTGVEASVKTRGASARQMASSANGRLLMTAGPGKIKSGVLGVFGGDLIRELAGKLNPFAAQDPYTQLDCIVTRANIVDGYVTLDPVLMQSKKVTVVAQGKVDLHTEKLTLNFNTRPRKGVGISAGMFTNPFIELAGTLTSPRIAVSATGVAAAAATGGVTVLAQGVWDRVRGGQDVCGQTLTEVGALPK